jgi:RNA polymerase sigma-70 factor (ECF subfamily)
MLDEKEIIRNILSGDRDAFGEIILKYQDFIFNLIKGYVKIEEEAKDITQDVFIRAYKGIEKFRGDSKLSSWLYRIAYNLSINWIKRKKIDEVEINEDMVENTTVTKDWYDKMFEKEMIFENLNKVIENLPQKYKIVIKLYYFEDRSYSEIAKILNIPLNTVKIQLLRAKKIMEKSLTS